MTQFWRHSMFVNTVMVFSKEGKVLTKVCMNWKNINARNISIYFYSIILSILIYLITLLWANKSSSNVLRSNMENRCEYFQGFFQTPGLSRDRFYKKSFE